MQTTIFTHVVDLTEYDEVLYVKPYELSMNEEMAKYLSTITPPPPPYEEINDRRDNYGVSFLLCICGFRKNCDKYKNIGYDCENLRPYEDTFLRAPWCKNYKQYSIGQCFCKNNCKCIKIDKKRCC